jgi:hypothetical protein
MMCRFTPPLAAAESVATSSAWISSYTKAAASRKVTPIRHWGKKGTS